MLRIRLRKPGKSAKGRTANKIVVIEKEKARDGLFVAQLGHYDPASKKLSMDTAAYQEWVKKGAVPTDTVAALYKRFTKVVKSA